MSDDQRGRQRDAVFMIAIGLGVTTLCGSCTYHVVATGGAYGLEYIIGGAPTLAGAGMFGWGLVTLRKPRSREP